MIDCPALALLDAALGGGLAALLLAAPGPFNRAFKAEIGKTPTESAETAPASRVPRTAAGGGTAGNPTLLPAGRSRWYVTSITDRLPTRNARPAPAKQRALRGRTPLIIASHGIGRAEREQERIE